ncbi:MAG: L-aspartate oxidase [Candidatus Hodarchaeota archaeon]
MNSIKKKTDFLIVGTGISGLFLARKISRFGSVLLITKKLKTDSNSTNAQGGIAVVLSDEDSIEKHIQDTLNAGDGLCDVDVTRKIIENGPRCVRELIDFDIPFSKNADGSFNLGKEGGHTTRRVIHAGDFTGNTVQNSLLELIEKECPDIELMEKVIGINLAMKNGKCIGLYTYNTESDEILSIEARYTILATGGAGKVYMFTSNPDVATGDGIAMAYRAGADIMNMEFFQFHPTCLYHPYAKSFLISEALRGEGAVLLNPQDGERFMYNYNEAGELAPRDIVSRAIDQEMKENGIDCVYLDISFKSSDFIKKRFPNIYARCLSYGIDITKEPIPVVPAAHYCCGGVRANIDGTTNIKGLLVIGETSCTGFHGANRLASNSLLECIVMGAGTAKYLEKQMGSNPHVHETFEAWDPGEATRSKEAVVVKHNWDEIRSVMWNYVGIVRTVSNLNRAMKRLSYIQEEIKDYYWKYFLTSDLIELRNLATVAELIVKSAIMRKESRGTHYNLDYPGKMENPTNTILNREKNK